MAGEKKDLQVEMSSATQIDVLPELQPPESLRAMSPEELKKAELHLVRKLDCRLVFPLIIIYIMNYLDRNAIAAAKVAGIEDDLGLSGSEFQLSVSILFIG